MGKTLWFGGAVLLMFCAFCAKESTPEAGDIANDLTTAMDRFQAGEITEGVDLVLNAVMTAAETAGLSENFMEKITEIREEENFFSPNTPALLREAYELIGHDPEFPEPGGEIGSVAEAVRMKLLEAQERIRTGDSSQAVRTLLESLIVMMPPSPQ